MPSEHPHTENNVPFIDAILPGLGGLLAGGVFLLPAMAVDAVGPAALISLLLAAALALGLARLAVSPDRSGAPFSSFVPWWMGAVARIAAASALAGVLSAYLLPRGTDATHSVVAGAALLLAGAAVMLGVASSPSAVSIATGAAVVGIGFYVGLAAPLATRSGFVPFAPHGWAAVLPGAGLLFFLFGGLEYPLCLSGVIVRPRQSIPRAALLGAALMAVIALIVTAVSVGVGGSAFTTHRLFARSVDHAPLLSIAAATGQPIALWGLSVGASVCCAVAIHRLLSEAAESIASLARLGQLPRALGVASGSGDAPWAAALAASAIAIGASRVASLEGLIEFASGAVLVSYLARLASRGWAWLAGAIVLMLALMPPSAWRSVGAAAILGVACYAARGLWKTAS
ncbi:MAG TPA: hypothetical protein VGM51_02240 [Armatimonadota bacterium]|jgi:amino acid transporter